jgi:hypothetical protein
MSAPLKAASASLSASTEQHVSGAGAANVLVRILGELMEHPWIVAVSLLVVLHIALLAYLFMALCNQEGKKRPSDASRVRKYD